MIQKEFFRNLQTLANTGNLRLSDRERNSIENMLIELLIDNNHTSVSFRGEISKSLSLVISYGNGNGTSSFCHVGEADQGHIKRFRFHVVQKDVSSYKDIKLKPAKLQPEISNIKIMSDDLQVPRHHLLFYSKIYMDGEGVFQGWYFDREPDSYYD